MCQSVLIHDSNKKMKFSRFIDKILMNSIHIFTQQSYKDRDVVFQKTFRAKFGGSTLFTIMACKKDLNEKL